MTTEAAPQGKIFLVGPRASGKTSLGRALAGRLGMPFKDLDAVLVDRIGETIAALVQREGWPAFRKLESEILAEVCQGGDLAPAAGRGVVAATGGGVILDPDNRALLRASGLVILLWATPEVLLKRLEHERLAHQRPALTELSWEDEMRRTLKEREPLYRDCADAVLDSSKPLDELAREAEALYRGRRP